MNYVKAVAYGRDNSSLEELAAHRMASLPNSSGYEAFARIVRTVDAVQDSERRAAIKRARVIQELTREITGEYEAP